MPCMYEFAKLSKTEIKKVESLEKELDATLLAYKMMEYAELEKEDLKLLKEMEKKLGLTLLAIK